MARCGPPNTNCPCRDRGTLHEVDDLFVLGQLLCRPRWRLADGRAAGRDHIGGLMIPFWRLHLEVEAP